MFSLNQLRTFLVVAESGSVGGAAEQLAISQPAVSSALASLAEECEAALVQREGRGIRLTAAGETLALYARRAFAVLEEARRQTREAAKSASRRHLRLAAVTTVAEHVIAELLRGFRALEPEIEVELYVANRAHVWDRLRHWEADLAVGGRPPIDPAFATLAMRKNELLAIASPDGVSDYSRATWLLRESGSGTRATTEAFLASLGIAPPTLTIGSNGAIRECVRAGLGVSLLSRDSVAQDLASGTLAIIPVPGTPIRRDWHLVRAADCDLSYAAQTFVGYAIRTGVFRAPEEK